MLKKLWDFLFYSCQHEWEVIGNHHGGHVIVYVNRCKKCGTLKNHEVS